MPKLLEVSYQIPGGFSDPKRPLSTFRYFYVDGLLPERKHIIAALKQTQLPFVEASVLMKFTSKSVEEITDKGFPIRSL